MSYVEYRVSTPVVDTSAHGGGSADGARLGQWIRAASSPGTQSLPP
jgi:hypothetical protein